MVIDCQSWLAPDPIWFAPPRVEPSAQRERVVLRIRRRARPHNEQPHFRRSAAGRRRPLRQHAQVSGRLRAAAGLLAVADAVRQPLRCGARRPALRCDGEGHHRQYGMDSLLWAYNNTHFKPNIADIYTSTKHLEWFSVYSSNFMLRFGFVLPVSTQLRYNLFVTLICDKLYHLQQKWE